MKLVIPKSEYILLKDNKDLLGKRARFKNNLQTYTERLWLKEGVIIQHKGLEHVGLSIKFDKGMNNKKDGWGLDTCYIMPDSFELIQ